MCEEGPLAAFAPTLRAADCSELALDTWRWLLESAADVDVTRERRVPALVTVACVYAKTCAPPAATPRESRLVARFTLLFFLVDDAALDDLPQLLAPQAAWSIGRYTPALRAWLADFHEQASTSRALGDRFAGAYHDYLAARRAEHEHKTRPLTLDEHWAFRRRSIFMDPYLDLWMILRRVEPSRVQTTAFDEARRLAIDLVLLANDLGSLERDRAGGVAEDDLNLLHSYSRDFAEPESATLERLIVVHDDMIERYRRALSAAASDAAGVAGRSYADILSGVIDGNVAAVLALEFRYPGAAPILQRLASAR